MIQLTPRRKAALAIVVVAGVGIFIYVKRKRVRELVEYAGEQAYEAGEAVVGQAQAVSEKAQAVSQKVVERATDVVKKIVAAVGGIPKFVVDNFNKNNLPELIEKYRGDFPWSVAAAIIHKESKGVADSTNPSGATGILQIVKPRAGMTKEDRTDPAKSLAAIVPEWQRFLRKIRAAGITDPHEQWAWVYYGHNTGEGALGIALTHVSEGLEKAATYYRNPWAKPKKGETKEQAIDRDIAARVAYARTVADTAVEWAVVEQNMKSGNMAGVLSSIVVV
jgi:hypothetical protein